LVDDKIGVEKTDHQEGGNTAQGKHGIGGLVNAVFEDHGQQKDVQ
jgi:hypothetical protein